MVEEKRIFAWFSPLARRLSASPGRRAKPFSWDGAKWKGDFI
jgi:hypothetical protein